MVTMIYRWRVKLVGRCDYDKYWVFHLDISSSTFSKVSFRKIIRVSNSLVPDQAQQKVGPDLGPIVYK